MAENALWNQLDHNVTMGTVSAFLSQAYTNHVHYSVRESTEHQEAAAASTQVYTNLVMSEPKTQVSILTGLRTGQEALPQGTTALSNRQPAR